MPKLLVHERARRDVYAIAAHIARDHLDAALRFIDSAEAAFDVLASWPGAGPRIEPPLTAFPDARFWPIKRFRNYLVIYQPTEEGAEIFRVIHGAQDMTRLH